MTVKIISEYVHHFQLALISSKIGIIQPGAIPNLIAKFHEKSVHNIVSKLVNWQAHPPAKVKT